MISILEKYNFIVGLSNEKGKETFLRKRLDSNTLPPAMIQLRKKIKGKNLKIKVKPLKV